ncbi:3-phenylpropionate/trans-cinnamate dioxygenase ferredoxin reductase subunit [Roseovarius litoreus]|uniref:3-phenylpropionate/trans-cinnamate dioxygenase ferredoxin reductase subunit n=1 Tax=Roseovarius litoreus TaxID=1155722 RepID=A0A1M7JFH5_9RHOB|nr:FAD-dependent oxidoreductase [Roseovarius litoreus]SHM51631.1 3-phenylpropionate/trans-cinnamate dioxygenase ferredoxin reductase subunit [Roseovarius litoreus]
MTGIVVIGGGQAGAALVAKLREAGYSGRLTLICGERVPPYQRPPLSKAYLKGDMERERLFLRPESFYASQDIDLRLGDRVTEIDPAARLLKVGGATLAYSQLALTTGSVPRRLPALIGGSLRGVYVMRGLADIDAMAAEFVAGRRLLIVGGGYIGLEAAAVAASLGLEVTLVEAAPRILQRVAAPETSNYFRTLHKSYGVRLLEGTSLDRLLGSGTVKGAVLNDGRELETDFVLVGVGVSPATGLAERAGIAIDNGIWTDELGRTSDRAIWAAGDCASFPYKDMQIRLESVGHAIDHAECVAVNMLGAGLPYIAKPWFWSDQYDVKLQIAGLNSGYDRVVERSGKCISTSIWYYKGDQLLAVDAVNDPRAYMAAKRIIEAGQTVDPRLVQDPNTDLRDLLVTAAAPQTKASGF